MDFMPSTYRMEMIHMVPVMSKFDTDPDMARASQCRDLPPRKYESRPAAARLAYQNPRPTTNAK